MLNYVKNVDNFKKWLDDNCKYEFFDLEAYIEDAFKQYGETGTAAYELSSNESKSGCPELYPFKVENDYIIF